MRSLLVFVLASTALYLCSCEDWPKHLEFGTRVPDARLEVKLDEPSLKYALYRRFEKAAHRGGYFDWRGRPLTEENIREDNLPTAYHWYPNEASDHSDYRIGFLLPRGDERPSSFTFIFYNANTSAFTDKEWRMFFQWKDVLLPRIFPDASIEVTEHPARYTNRDDLAGISRSTGIPVPERYRDDRSGN